MTKSVQKQEFYRKNDELYNADYYQQYNGYEYGRNEHWLGFFGLIADNIIKKIDEILLNKEKEILEN